MTRSCPACGADTVAFPVDEAYRELIPAAANSSADSAADATADGSVAAICTRCLTVSIPSADGGRDADTDTDTDTDTESVAVDPDFSRVSDAFPTRLERAAPLALAIGLCSSLATNRSAIERLLTDVERAGADPLLVLDRLAADPGIESAIDLERRVHQLEQLSY
ncbi:DUF6276 family protein [Natrialbaceae archaeon GCM10025810]|uniref:DUF6276 family protein n=1 Tax=Halovalidus salilacus TaxID=3075124 RepID=UPI003614768A